MHRHGTWFELSDFHTRLTNAYSRGRQGKKWGEKETKWERAQAELCWISLDSIILSVSFQRLTRGASSTGASSLVCWDCVHWESASRQLGHYNTQTPCLRCTNILCAFINNFEFFNLPKQTNLCFMWLFFSSYFIIIFFLECIQFLPLNQFHLIFQLQLYLFLNITIYPGFIFTQSVYFKCIAE